MSTQVLANMGTPLMFLGCGHLLFLNLLLGAVEGGLLARWANVRTTPAIAFMIAGNYVSAWIGYALLMFAGPLRVYDIFPDPPVYHVGTLLAVAAVLTLFLTILIEMPFCLFAMRKGKSSLARRLACGAIAQVITYAGLALLYLPASPMTVITKCERLKDASTFVPKLDAWVYYLDRDRWVHRCRVDGRSNERVTHAGTDGWLIGPGEGLYADQGLDGTLNVHLTLKGQSNVVATLERGRVGDDGAQGYGQQPPYPAYTWPLDLRPPDRRPDYYIAMPMPEMGLVHRVWTDASRRSAPAVFSLKVASPFFQWQPAFPTMLPGGLVVFELGNQIMVMDSQRRIAAIARGRSPLVIMDTSPEPPISAP